MFGITERLALERHNRATRRPEERRKTEPAVTPAPKAWRLPKFDPCVQLEEELQAREDKLRDVLTVNAQLRDRVRTLERDKRKLKNSCDDLHAHFEEETERLELERLLGGRARSPEPFQTPVKTLDYRRQSHDINAEIEVARAHEQELLKHADAQHQKSLQLQERLRELEGPYGPVAKEGKGKGEMSEARVECLLLTERAEAERAKIRAEEQSRFAQAQKMDNDLLRQRVQQLQEDLLITEQAEVERARRIADEQTNYAMAQKMDNDLLLAKVQQLQESLDFERQRHQTSSVNTTAAGTIMLHKKGHQALNTMSAATISTNAGSAVSPFVAALHGQSSSCSASKESFVETGSAASPFVATMHGQGLSCPSSAASSVESRSSSRASSREISLQPALRLAQLQPAAIPDASDMDHRPPTLRLAHLQPAAVTEANEAFAQTFAQQDGGHYCGHGSPIPPFIARMHGQGSSCSSSAASFVESLSCSRGSSCSSERGSVALGSHRVLGTSRPPPSRSPGRSREDINAAWLARARSAEALTDESRSAGPVPRAPLQLGLARRGRSRSTDRISRAQGLAIDQYPVADLRFAPAQSGASTGTPLPTPRPATPPRGRASAPSLSAVYSFSKLPDPKGAKQVGFDDYDTPRVPTLKSPRLPSVGTLDKAPLEEKKPETYAEWISRETASWFACMSWSNIVSSGCCRAKAVSFADYESDAEGRTASAAREQARALMRGGPHSASATF